MTDHYMILCMRKPSANFRAKRNRIETDLRSMKNYDRDAFLCDLQDVGWERGLRPRPVVTYNK